VSPSCDGCGAPADVEPGGLAVCDDCADTIRDARSSDWSTFEEWLAAERVDGRCGVCGSSEGLQMECVTPMESVEWVCDVCVARGHGWS